MKDQQVKKALDSIQRFQKKAGTAGDGMSFATGRWQLNVPVIRLALEGVFVFGVAFMCGKGIGVFYEVMAQAFFGS
ncbi:MAG: hypothetical protein ACYTGH_16935 [Planctomycetota bacterium]|jgi:hypothetical protein